MPHLKPRIKTLSGYKAFTKVITCGKRFENTPIKAFVYSFVSTEPIVRIGYAVARKASSAVMRNRLKRLMRESFHANEEAFIQKISTEKTFEIVFMYTGRKAAAPKTVKLESIKDALSDICLMITNEDIE